LGNTLKGTCICHASALAQRKVGKKDNLIWLVLDWPIGSPYLSKSDTITQNLKEKEKKSKVRLNTKKLR
jgi:hypothetical protein